MFLRVAFIWERKITHSTKAILVSGFGTEKEYLLMKKVYCAKIPLNYQEFYLFVFVTYHFKTDIDLLQQIPNLNKSHPHPHPTPLTYPGEVTFQGLNQV